MLSIGILGFFVGCVLAGVVDCIGYIYDMQEDINHDSKRSSN